MTSNNTSEPIHKFHTKADASANEGQRCESIIKTRKTLLSVTFVAITAFTVACKPPEQPPAKTTSEQFDKIKIETKAAAQDIKTYTFAQKAEFNERMKGQLTEIKTDLDRLEAQIEKATDAVKSEAKPKLQALRDQTARLTQQLDESKNASESTWGEVKAGFSKGYSELKDDFQATRQWVSDKIAPPAPGHETKQTPN